MRTPPTIWPFQLRPGATFHTDAPILADDVAVTSAARNGIAPHQAPDNQLRLRQVTTL